MLHNLAALYFIVYMKKLSNLKNSHFCLKKFGKQSPFSLRPNINVNRI